MKITPIVTKFLESEGINLEAVVPVSSDFPFTWRVLLEFLDCKFPHQNPALLFDIESILTTDTSLIPYFTLLAHGMAEMLENGLVEVLPHKHI
jgi:hypothetical protein